MRNTMKHSKPGWRIHPEGKPWVLGGLLGTLLFASRGKRKTALATAFFSAALAYFFRDPERYSPTASQVVVSPADGEIVVVEQTEEPRWIEGPAWRIAIFMSLTDVHINRAPLDAYVVRIEHRPGEFLPAYHAEAAQRNERRLYFLETEDLRRALVIQIAGIMARRTVPLVSPGTLLQRGDRFGLIRFGSRVEVFLPRAAQPLVAPGQRVRAGETPIAWWPTPHEAKEEQ